MKIRTPLLFATFSLIGIVLLLSVVSSINVNAEAAVPTADLTSTIMAAVYETQTAVPTTTLMTTSTQVITTTPLPYVAPEAVSVVSLDYDFSNIGNNSIEPLLRIVVIGASDNFSASALAKVSYSTRSDFPEISGDLYDHFGFPCVGDSHAIMTRTGNDFGTPVSYSSPFKNGDKAQHAGVDIYCVTPSGAIDYNIGAPMDAEVFSTIGDGQRDWAYRWSSSGNTIVLRTKHEGNCYYATSAHLAKFSVGAGAFVEQGQLVGIMGETGNAHGAHNHFTIAVDMGCDGVFYFAPPRLFNILIA